MSNKEDEGGVYVIEKIQISEESSEQSVDLEDEYLSMDESEDQQTQDQGFQTLDKLIQTTQSNLFKQENEFQHTQVETEKPKMETKMVQRLEVVDDFIRNYMIKNKMTKSLEIFQQEYYELHKKGQPVSSINVPDVYIRNEKLEEQINYLSSELDKARIMAEKAKGTWDKLRKERDFHKMHHQRVQQEKKKLNLDIEKLKTLHKTYEIKYLELSQKYEVVIKEKMLVKLERDRLLIKTETLGKQLQQIEEKFHGGGQTAEAQNDTKVAIEKKGDNARKPTQKLTPIPKDDRQNPHTHQTYEPYTYKNYSLQKTFKGHMMAIPSIAFHPRKSILATASDDYTWKIWTIPTGDLIMSGEGHRDWVSGIAFHPRGSHLATSSGDCTIKIWDFLNASCSHTFKEHQQPIWSVQFNDTGDFVLSSSMDHTAKLLDLNALKHVMTFRGHVDSVNDVMFKPYTNIFASASADKTVSFWDIRSGLCVSTLYGHLNSVNKVRFNLKGDLLASCDSDGIVKVWDTRMIKERFNFLFRSQYDVGPYSANSVCFDKSGNFLAVASDDGNIKILNDTNQKFESTLKGHEDAVLDVIFDYNSKALISSSADFSFRVWS